jgi:pimeloyl-ACP methyl ester carboxylesterase
MLGVSTLVASRPSRGRPIEEGELELSTLRLEHEALLALPRATAPVPLVVLLHGLAETMDAHVGARAWVDRYGLADGVRRLRHAPLARLSARDDWGDSIRALNTSLGNAPFRGLAFVCPHVPRMVVRELDAYARWIDDVLVPRARAEAGERIGVARAFIGGCSYGGWVSLEVFLRAPDRFGGWAGVQTAIGQASVADDAERLSLAAQRRPLFIETSRLDPFHDAGVALANGLWARGTPCDLSVLPGPHDQPWLQESGTTSLLAWLDGASRGE